MHYKKDIEEYAATAMGEYGAVPDIDEIVNLVTECRENLLLDLSEDAIDLMETIGSKAEKEYMKVAACDGILHIMQQNPEKWGYKGIKSLGSVDGAWGLSQILDFATMTKMDQDIKDIMLITAFDTLRERYEIKGQDLILKELLNRDPNTTSRCINILKDRAITHNDNDSIHMLQDLVVYTEAQNLNIIEALLEINNDVSHNALLDTLEIINDRLNMEGNEHYNAMFWRVMKRQFNLDKPRDDGTDTDYNEWPQP